MVFRAGKVQEQFDDIGQAATVLTESWCSEKRLKLAMHVPEFARCFDLLLRL